MCAGGGGDGGNHRENTGAEHDGGYAGGGDGQGKGAEAAAHGGSGGTGSVAKSQLVLDSGECFVIVRWNI